MGERFVNASLMAPHTRVTVPIASRTIVCFEDPRSDEYRKLMRFGGSLTTCLALVETEKQKNHATHDQEQA